MTKTKWYAKPIYVLVALALALSLSLVPAVPVGAVGETFELDGLTFNSDYGPDRGYIAYIQPYDAENQFHSLPDQAIEQYGNPADTPLGPWREGDLFNFEYGKAFGGGETKSWGGQNYVVTYWWNPCVGEYLPINDAGGDIYFSQPSDGTRPMGILYQGQWRMFDVGTNGLSAERGAEFWWDLSDAGVAEGDTIEALAWWCNALGFPGLEIEKKLADGSKVYPPYPDALDMDGNGSTEPLTFIGGGSSMSYHDPFYMGIKYATVVLPPPEVWVDDDYFFGGDNDGHTWCYDAFATIQDGINTVVEVGTVNVAPGIYNEDVTIDKDLTLVGAQFGVDPRGGRAGDESEIVGVVVVTSPATDVVFDGFKFTSPTRTFSPRGFNLHIESESSTVTNNIFVAEENAGHTWSGYLDFGGITNATVTQNSFSGDLDLTQTPNVVMLGIAGAGIATIADNEMHDVGGGGGIGIMCGNDAAVVNIDGNVIENTGNECIWIWNSGGSAFDALSITSNDLSEATVNGIKFVAPITGVVSVSGNEFRDNPVQVLDSAEILDIQAVLGTNTFDRAVVVNCPTTSFLHTIWSSIQDAIDVADTDDTVLVKAGTYAESVSISTSLQLLGAKAGVPAGPDASPAGRSNPDEESIIDGHITITGASEAIIDGFTILSGGQHGITLSGGDVIKNNIIDGGPGNETSGGIWSGGSGGHFIANNNIRNYQRGMLFDGDVVPQFTVTENYITGSSSTGIILMGSLCNGHIITNNLIEENSSGMVLAQGEHQVSGNTIRNNDGSGIYILALPRTYGIRIIQNTIEGNAGTAIYLDGDDPGAVDNVAHFNNIVGNAAGVFNNHTAVFDATHNWWGTVNGPTHADNTFNVVEQGDAVSGLVDFVPWLDASDGEPFAPVRTTDPPGGFASIQAGVTASNTAGTVNVTAGTYTENVSIPPGKDNLRLLGAGMADTILSPASGTAISVYSPVIIKGFYILQSDSATGIQMMVAGASGTSENRGIIDANKLESPSASRGNGIDFKDYDINYWVIKDNELINRKLAIYLNQASHLVITGNTLTGYKEGIGTNWSGAPNHDLIIVGNSFLGTDYPFTEQELQEKAAIMLGEVSYDVLIAGNTITDSPSGIRIPDHAEGVTNLSNVHINVNDIYNNTNYGIINDVSVEVDATYNWWGSVNGPGQDGANGVLGAVDYSPWLPGEWNLFFIEGNPIDSDNDGFSDLDEYWLGTDPNDPDSYPDAGIGEVDTAYLEGDGQVNLEDSEGTIADVGISGGGDGSGTITGARYTDDPGETTLSVGTGTSGVVFLDVRVTGYTEGIAHIIVPYPDTDQDGIVDDTTVVETTLGLYYWDDATAGWLIADNNVVDADANTVSGDIPISALTGTPIGGGGYLVDEAIVAIESILNLSFSGDDFVHLTISTNTAFLGAATIDLTFDPRVVEVLSGENSDFDTLTVNLNYAVIGSDTQVARFVVYQDQVTGEGVDATGGAVVVEVKLKAVGSTMDVSPLILHLETLTDNKGDTIPFNLGTNDSRAIVGGIGDANGDGVVDSFDCVYIARAIAGFTGYSIDTPTMDVSGDGMVDAWDCTYLARHIVGLGYPLGG